MERGGRTIVAYRRIVDDAIGALTAPLETNLYLDIVPYAKGSAIGPRVQGLYAKRKCLVVFVDENPRANFGHACRYRIYDAQSQDFLYEERARFPPYRRRRKPGTFVPVHDPIRPASAEPIGPSISTRDAIAPRERYAILFSGSSDRRHLNELEYCWRMLTRQYGFKPDNILVLYFDKTLSFAEPEPATNWPQEPINAAATHPYLLKLFGKGDRDGFQEACRKIATTLQPQDLVFMQISGHGDADGTVEPPQSYLLQHDGLAYRADDLCQDLALLGRHDSLLVLMEQCFSTGFIAPLMSAQNTVQAQQLSIACASKDVSFPTADGLFNSFGAGWITSHLSSDPYGNATPAVDQNTNGFIEASEAYAHAAVVADQNDLPDKAHSPGAAADIHLA